MKKIKRKRNTAKVQDKTVKKKQEGNEWTKMKCRGRREKKGRTERLMESDESILRLLGRENVKVPDSLLAWQYLQTCHAVP